MRKTEWSYTLIFLLLLACNNKNTTQAIVDTNSTTELFPIIISLVLNIGNILCKCFSTVRVCPRFFLLQL